MGRIGKLSAFAICVCLAPSAPAQETADVVAPADLVLRGGQVITLDPDDRVTQALRILSTYGAYAGFEEKTRGTLQVGKLADLVVLSMDPLSIAPGRLKDLRIDATILDGDDD